MTGQEKKPNQDKEMSRRKLLATGAGVGAAALLTATAINAGFKADRLIKESQKDTGGSPLPRDLDPKAAVRQQVTREQERIIIEGTRYTESAERKRILQAEMDKSAKLIVDISRKEARHLAETHDFTDENSNKFREITISGFAHGSNLDRASVIVPLNANDEVDWKKGTQSVMFAMPDYSGDKSGINVEPPKLDTYIITKEDFDGVPGYAAVIGNESPLKKDYLSSSPKEAGRDVKYLKSIDEGVISGVRTGTHMLKHSFS